MVELKEFSKLLTKAVHKIKEQEGKRISAIHDDLAYAIGKESGSCIEDWRKPRPNGKPPHPDQIRMLAQELAKRKAIDEAELEQLLEFAKFMEGHGKNTSLSPINKPRPLHNLSTPYYPEFIGRMTDINLIQQGLSEESKINKVLIYAAGGMGKTTLTHHIAWGYVEKPSYFEAVIWVTAQEERFEGYNENIISPIDETSRKLTDIYKTIALCLHREDILDRPATETRRYIDNALSKQPTLLIVDNFETVKAENNIKNFIISLPATTKVLITSREKIIFPNFNYHELKPLFKSESIALIQSHLNHLKQIDNITLSDKQQHDLWEVTQGHAIAIVWSLGRMVHDVDIEQILIELQTARDQGEFDENLHDSKNKLANFCFERSFAPLKGQPAARLLAAMCLFAPNQATPMSLQYITNISPKEYDTAIKKLNRLAFICEIDDRLGILPLTREFAIHYVTEEMKHLFVDYFAGLCYGVTKGDYWGGVKVNAKLIEAELPNIYIAFDLATSLQDWRGVQNIYVGLTHILSVSRIFYKRRIILAQKALQAAEELGDVEMQAWYYIDALGWAFMAIREPEEGLKQITKGQKLAEDNNLTQCSACADVVLAEYEFFYQHNEEACLKYIDSGWSKQPELFIQSRLHQSQMKCYRQKKEWEAAKNICLRAIELASEYPFDVAWLQRFLGESYLYLKEWDKAEESFKRSIDLYDENSYHRHSLVTNIGLAKVYFHQGNEEEMSKYIQKAKSFCHEFELEQELEVIEIFIKHPEKDFDLRHLDLF